MGVTRRKHRSRSCPDRPESCHGARRVRRGFCHPGTSFNRRYACRGTSFIEPEQLSRCRMFQMSTGAVSRYKFDRSQKTVTVQDLILRAGARVQVQVLAGFVMGAGFCKNHDEPINYTVRVMCCSVYFFVT